MSEAGELAVGAIQYMPCDHQDEAGDRKSQVLIAVIGKASQDAKQHARDGNRIGRNAHPRKERQETARHRMDEVTIGDLLDFRRSPDGLRVLHGTSDRARRGPLGQSACEMGTAKFEPEKLDRIAKFTPITLPLALNTG